MVTNSCATCAAGSMTDSMTAPAAPDLQPLVSVIMIFLNAESFIAEHAVSFPSLFDPDASVRTELGSFGLPVTVFFDADGDQVAKVDGELSQSALDEHLTEISPGS